MKSLGEEISREIDINIKLLKRMRNHPGMSFPDLRFNQLKEDLKAARLAVSNHDYAGISAAYEKLRRNHE